LEVYTDIVLDAKKENTTQKVKIDPGFDIFFQQSN